MDSKDLLLAVEELNADKRLDKDTILNALEEGLSSAYRKDFGEKTPVKINIVETEKEKLVKFYTVKKVVEEVENKDSEISLQEAKAINEKYEVDDEFYTEFTPDVFSRIATQTAKQVISQKINDAHKALVEQEMSSKKGQLMNVIVRKVGPKLLNVEITNNNMPAIMYKRDQIRGEEYRVGEQYKVIIKDVDTERNETQVLVSRAEAGFVKCLMEMEIPEIRAKQVEIKGIVREAGYRTKVAVHTDDVNIDPVGACIGNKGSRINTIVAELKGEKIDVILYSSNPGEYISRALSPAKLTMLRINDKEKAAIAIVPDDKLSLAIGKGGMNVRLAARLTGWKIDIKSVSQAQEELGMIDADADSKNSKQSEDALSKMFSDMLSEDNKTENPDDVFAAFNKED